ncbi:MAG: C40 family peptidase [Bacteroidales bacterium]|nr:C40 family peptidase [Candidatus Liminaster caballi]
MIYAICLQPYIPMRATAAESSEMTNQLLFGDTFRIVEEIPRWYRIVRDCDDYEGWIDWKTATLIEKHDYDDYLRKADEALLLRQPYNVVQQIAPSGQTASLHLSWGSRIFNMDDMGISFRMQGKRFDVPNMTYVNPVKTASMSRNACAKYLLQQAQMLLNVPYLWGGCSAFGIDCSGFTQTLFRFVGVRLPRNASQQALIGEEVAYKDRLVGDLAFFNHGEGNGKITHVGVCDDQGRVLHCSASLHYDELREDGIWSIEQQKLTHNLVSIRRVF